MPETTPQTTTLRVSDLPTGRETPFAIRPDTAALKALAQELDIDSIRKLTFTGVLRPEGRNDWTLEADLGATVIQPCVVTLAPVTTRIDQTIRRRFLADPGQVPQGDEIEMPEDDTIEPLRGVIDLDAVMAEALALALPDYPRVQEASLEQTAFAPPGADPVTDDDLRPFAGLADLKKKLDGGN